MTDLSLAAQTVRDAVLSTYAETTYKIPKNDNLWALERASTVAALRAAAKHVASCDNQGVTLWDKGFVAGVNSVYKDLLAIANELENAK